MVYKMKGWSGYQSSPAKQNSEFEKEKEKWESYYSLTEEEKNTPTEEELDQERINKQIEGTYVETEEDVKKRKEELRKHAPRKKSPMEQKGTYNVSEEDHAKQNPYWYKIDGKRVSKYVYNKYENKPGEMEGGGKTTNDPDPSGRKEQRAKDREKLRKPTVLTELQTKNLKK